MAIKTGTAKAVSSYFSPVGNITWKRTGNVVSFIAQGKIDFDALPTENTSVEIITGLPKPALSFAVALQIMKGGVGADNIATLDTNGSLKINKSSSLETGKPYSFISATYITTD